MTQYVICALQMEGFHCWPEADGELAYLKNSHRHIFFITAEFPVHNANREIEIISQQNAIKRYLLSKYGDEDGACHFGRRSCEDIAAEILNQFENSTSCTVLEDGFVIANVTGARTITTGLHIGPIELALSGGAITYAVTFLCTDIIGEIWGKATAQRVVKYGFIGQIFATACIMITGVFPATDAVMDNAYQTLLGQNWIFVIGSLSAYLVSQSWDVAVFHAIRDRYIAKHGSTKGGRWLWNNGSTITSQIWDTVIYAVISFGFGLGWVHTHEGRMQLIGIIIGQYLLKACLALLDTPFFYFFTRNADRR